ncbi:MAG: transcription antitermination factor NusB [Rhodospirillales bacterium]
MTGTRGTAVADPGASQRRRSAARLAAVQALYEMDMVGAEADAVLTEFLQQRWRLDDTGGEPMVEPDGEWLGDLVNGVATRRGELDGLIGQALTKDLALERLETLLRVILRAGAYELSSKRDVPAAAIISEYVEVAHAFFDAKEANLVNGVLDHLARELRAGEL